MTPINPQELRKHYTKFLATDRVLLTGHSHQAWPDVGRQAMNACWDDAARFVDDKWTLAAEAADAVRTQAATLLHGRPEQMALGSNTHELVCRFLSALDFGRRPHLVTTAGEFHSIHRQLRRLEEAGVEVSRVAVAPLETLSQRLAEAVRPTTAALLSSTVLFETSAWVEGLEVAAERAFEQGAEVLLDAYHQLGVIPWTEIASRAFVVGGGYKYLQWGEGACFMRVPLSCSLRPVYTGWFSDFAALESASVGLVGYGQTPADRFAGSTYDPTSHYRARAVIDFFASQNMDVTRLRASYLRQTARLIDALGTRNEILTPTSELRGGFVSIRVGGGADSGVDSAAEMASRLRKHGVWVDARGTCLRFGPAPYVLDAELDQAVERFEELRHG